MTAVLEIRLLGGLQITQNDTSVTGFISSKVPALLAYLAVTRRSHQRDVLAALLWGEMSDADAKNNLRQALSNLRKYLNPYLLITRDTAAFNTVVSHFLDTAVFEENIQTSYSTSNPIPLLEAAIRLYQGDFLAGFIVRDAPDFEDWLLTQRLRYRESTLQALHTLTEHYLRQGQYDRAVNSATRLLALDAWREEAHRQLMLALARSGQRSAALAQYQTCCRVLEQELGVAPSAATTALHGRIRAAGAMLPHTLPAQPTPFIGREAELVQIEHLLLNPDCRLLTLTGTGGMGKTRLALRAAEQAYYRGLFLHGVYFIPLIGIDTDTLLITAVATACGLKFEGSEEPAQQLFTFLREKELLLVLDNFEQLLEAADWLVQLLQQAPDIKLLLTSRESLNLQWEWNLPVEGLTLPPEATTDTQEIIQFSAVELFITRARTVRHDFSLTNEIMSDLIHICHLVTGMPLAIELAAGMIRHTSCGELAATIAQNLDTLTTTYRDMPPRHRSLRAVFENVWTVLSPAEQTLFAALSVFVGSFNATAAMTITAATAPLLQVLVDKSLLMTTGNGRYQLHNVLRQYAAQELLPEEQQRLQQQHAAFYTEWLQQQETGLFAPTETTIFQSVQANLENIRAAWHWALRQQQLTMLGNGLKVLRAFYNEQGRFQEGIDWLAETAVTLQPLSADYDPVTQIIYGKVLARWASFNAWRGQRVEAEALFEQALSIARYHNDPDELGFTLLNKGYLTVVTGDFATAGKEFQESLSCYRQTNNKKGIGDALSALGAWHNVTGDWDQARQCLTESVAIARETGNEPGLRSSLTNLGNVYYHLGEYEAAQTYYEEVLALCRKVGDRASEAIIQSNLGAIAQEMGDLVMAEQRLLQGIELFAAINHDQAVIHGLTMLASVFRAAQQFERSRQTLIQALQQAIENQYDYLIPIAVFEIGHWYQAQKRPLQALPLILWVIHHPAAQAENRQMGQLMVEEMIGKLSPEQITTVNAQSTMLDVVAVLADLKQ